MKKILVAAGAATLALATPSAAQAAGPVAGVAGVSTSASYPTCDNGQTGSLTIRQATNTASYTGTVKYNGAVIRSFTLTKSAMTLTGWSGVVAEPVVITVTINRGGIGPVSQSTLYEPASCDA